MREPGRLDDELDLLGTGLRRLATPQPPPALVAQVRRLGHLELADRADERFNRLLLALLLLFSWTVTLSVLFGVRLLRGGVVLGSVALPSLSWSFAWIVVAWVSGAAALGLLSFHVRQERRRA